MIIGILASPRTDVALASVVASIRAAGFYEYILILGSKGVERPDDQNLSFWTVAQANAFHRYTQLQCLLLEASKDHDLLIFEDDIEVCVGARDALNFLRWTRPDYALASLYCAEKERGILNEEGWACYTPSWGTQAVLYSRGHLEQYLQQVGSTNEYKPYDAVIFQWYDHLPVYTHCPSLVQHLGASLMDNRHHRGLDYDKEYRSQCVGTRQGR